LRSVEHRIAGRITSTFRYVTALLCIARQVLSRRMRSKPLETFLKLARSASLSRSRYRESSPPGSPAPTPPPRHPQLLCLLPSFFSPYPSIAVEQIPSQVTENNRSRYTFSVKLFAHCAAPNFYGASRPPGESNSHGEISPRPSTPRAVAWLKFSRLMNREEQDGRDEIGSAPTARTSPRNP
jgi:hypothetical protein